MRKEQEEKISKSLDDKYCSLWYKDMHKCKDFEKHSMDPKFCKFILPEDKCGCLVSNLQDKDKLDGSKKRPFKDNRY